MRQSFPSQIFVLSVFPNTVVKHVIKFLLVKMFDYPVHQNFTSSNIFAMQYISIFNSQYNIVTFRIYKVDRNYAANIICKTADWTIKLDNKVIPSLNDCATLNKYPC